ncbi:hypothetical protein [Rhodococcus tibetensis]|uniref:DUF304 domain-containing protein n=1 Tax=Rhodococcus tibetensis TaxID=2965064 RepID=A0ABT1Q8Q5_9NOCA|nr:hypothetical protein [Rhodococcus sp. FXJ9.536]MCQ4118639.1 hypothetical protein [Rhodococcus sp. FXJ9.536]
MSERSLAPEHNPPVSLDLVPIELIAPRLKRVAMIVVLVGVVVGAVLSFFAPLWLAVVVGGVIAVPTALSVLLTLRRKVELEHGVIRSTGGLRTCQVDVTKAVAAEVVVRSARVSEVSVRITDPDGILAVPLALYTNDGGRELDVLGLRKLADALTTSELVPAAAIASVLIEQLRAEARDAALTERPLFRAVDLVRAAGRIPTTTLTDHEVAALVD